MGSDLTEGGVVSTLLRASAPMVLAFLLQSSFNVVDAFFVGKISPEALAAVSMSFPLVFFVMSVGTGVGVGATSVVARFIGAKEYKRADNAAEHALLASLILGIALTVLLLPGVSYLFDVMGAEGSLKVLGIEYIEIILAFNVVSVLTMVATGILRGEGDMKTPMLVMAASALLNVILDPFFIFTLGLGVAGAAWATVLTQAMGLAYVGYHMLSGRSWIRLRPADFSYDFEYVRQVFVVGIPSSLSNIIMSVGMFFFTVLVASYGTEAIAAFGIGFRLDSLAILPALGVSVAVVSVVGQCVGAGKYERARQATMTAGVLSSVMMVCVGALFFAFAPQLVAIFNSDPKVVEYGTSILRILPLSYLVVGFAISITGAFLGSGKATLALAATFCRVLAFSVPMAYFLSSAVGLSGVWWGIAAGSFLGFLVSLILFRFGGWDR
jgi:putative MATE family efflux protein